MQMETEITVLVKSDYETLQKELEEKGFQIDEEYILNDVYMLDERIDISNMSYLEILKNCILVRNIIGFEMELLYKYKKELKSICTRMMFPFKKIFNKKLFVTFELDFYIKFYTTLSFRRTRVVF